MEILASKIGGVRKGQVPLMRTAIPDVGFLMGKAVLYKRTGKDLHVYPRTFGNMTRIVLKITWFVTKKRLALIPWYIREARDYCIIFYRTIKEKIKNARNKK